MIRARPKTRTAAESVEALGHRGFFQEGGIDLLAEAERLWDESQERRTA